MKKKNPKQPSWVKTKLSKKDRKTLNGALYGRNIDRS